MNRIWVLGGAALVTAMTLALALLLGTWAFDFRRFSMHEGRLQRVMEHEPTIDRLTEGFENEGTTVLASPVTPEEVEQVIAARGASLAEVLRAKARRWVRVRVYETTDEVYYFVFFDGDGVMRDFTLVGRMRD